MQLYVTDNGTWGGTKAEMPAKAREDGSRLGGWKAVEVPTRKDDLIAFLNHRKVGGEPEARKPRERKPPIPTGSGRFRVTGGLRERVFISSASADTPEEACQQVADTLRAYQPGE